MDCSHQQTNVRASDKHRYLPFAERLIDAMKQAGHHDTRSPSGISVKILAKTMGVSEQICRRYLRGEALPDHDKVIAIATFLSIPPGWLLFGDQSKPIGLSQQTVHIDRTLLHYLLERCHLFYTTKATEQSHDFPDFVLALINDISTIDASPEALKQIIDLAVDSIASFEARKMKHLNPKTSSL